MVRTAELLNEVRDNIAHLVAAANHSNDNSDFSMMETNFGLASGMGANVVTLINIMNDTFNTATEKDGATRLGQINEFAARIAGQ